MNPIVIRQHDYVVIFFFLFSPNLQVVEERLEDTWVPLDQTVAPEELEEMIRSKEAHTNAVILESVSHGSL